jgi:hypothetical protein
MLRQCPSCPLLPLHVFSSLSRQCSKKGGQYGSGTRGAGIFLHAPTRMRPLRKTAPPLMSFSLPCLTLTLPCNPRTLHYQLYRAASASIYRLLSSNPARSLSPFVGQASKSFQFFSPNDITSSSFRRSRRPIAPPSYFASFISLNLLQDPTTAPKNRAILATGTEDWTLYLRLKIRR